MKLSRLFFAVLWLGIAFHSAGAPAPKTQVRLLVSAETAKPGDDIMAGVELRMPPGWHTYWRNGGDSGAPSEIKWQLPKGVSAGAILWPVPEKLEEKLENESIVTYIYSEMVVLLVPLKLASDLPNGTLDLMADVSWLECKELCLPGSGKVRAHLNIGTTAKPSANAALIDSAQKKLPKNGASLNATAHWDAPPGRKERPLIIEWNSRVKPEGADFYPDRGQDYAIKGTTARLDLGDDKLGVRKIVVSEEEKWPSQVTGLIVTKASASAPMEAFEVTLNLAPDRANISAGAPAAAATKGGRHSLLAMLGLAFIGGLILNIMPCVLPVIALKILGFVNQSKESPERVRKLGVTYTLGVLSSFILLAGIVIGVQQAGKAANWGMQFQNAQFLIGMTTLVTLVALNLFGVFEVTLGGGAMNAAGALASKEGAAGAFFNGMLATALATPCTAPYLSFALGFAFAQSPAIIVLMFATIGLGLAAPYLVLSWYPQGLKFLPKPGPWMERFKQAMGFPMLATAIWLFSLTLIHFSEGAALWFGVFLVVLSMAAWIWGQFVQHGSQRRGLAMAISGALVAAAYLYVLEGELNWRKPVLATAGEDRPANDPNGIQWRRWSREAVEEARAAGHPVLVDFTAKWCTTCLVNKKTSLEIAAVREKLKSINGVAFRADYTREDPLITAELQRFERAAVPLVLVFPPDRSQPPIILPEVLRPGVVLDALSKAATTQVAVQSKR